MAKVGDIVRFLNSVGGGRISRIDGQVAYVDEDGFETPVLLKECVVVTPAPSGATHNAAAPKPQPAPQPAPAQQKAPADEPPFVETQEGEKLNIVLAYEAADLKRLSQTTYDAYIVNDSNYYLYITYLTRGNEQNGWIARYAGMVEPGMQIFLCEVERDHLTEMDRIAIQYIPFKLGKEFDLKAVACVEQKLDTTKFFKLHCFQPNPYFDEPVIAVNIVRNDVPQRQLNVRPQELEEAMREKAAADRRAPKMVKKERKSADEPIVVDLHIAELVDNTRGLSNADMLNLQISKFREVMDANLRHHGKTLIFIHGKGEGVLRQAIMKELNHRYKGHDVQDASFREYGYGATQVKIR